MSAITNEQVDAKRNELLLAIRPHTGQPMMQRINAYVFNKTGKKLPEFLGNGASNEEKHSIISELVTILKDQTYDLLPTAPVGQAQTPATPGAATPAKPTPKAAAPKPAAAAPAAPKPAEAETADETVEEDPEVLAIQLQLAKAKAAAAAKAKTSGITEEQVRTIVTDVLSGDGETSPVLEQLKCAEARALIEAIVDARLAEIFSTINSTLKKE